MKLIFDLDGTLICSKARLYNLFCRIVEPTNFSQEDYWSLKFLGYSHADILKKKYSFSDTQIEKFIYEWMMSIELDQYLIMDTLIEGAEDFLYNISLNNTLYLCTARQSYSQTIKQLTRLRIISYFENVFVTEQKYSKVELLKNSSIEFNHSDWIIGDTGHDIITGKELNINTCAVLSGFMSHEKLMNYKPDTIIPDITYFTVL